MAKLRRFRAYRALERPYTRISKYKKKSFIKTKTNVKVIRFVTGNPKKTFPYKLNLISKEGLQIRDNALESGRQSGNKILETTLGLSNYFMQVRPYPFHILRENPLASGAGADRFSTVMQKSFGKPIGSAARIKRGQIICTVAVNKQHTPLAKQALDRFRKKLPGSYFIKIEEQKVSPKII